MAQKRVAVLPVITKSNKNKICLVTSRYKRKWILPTGKHEKNRSDREVALLEAFEEAGVKGQLDDTFRKSLLVESPSGRKKRKITLYLIKVDQQLKSWPEKKQRRRVLINPSQIDRYLDDKRLKKVIRGHFAR